MKIESMEDLRSQYFQIVRQIFNIPLQQELVADSSKNNGKVEFDVKPGLLRDKSKELSFPENPNEGHERIPSEDLALAIQAVIQYYLKGLAAKG